MIRVVLDTNIFFSALIQPLCAAHRAGQGVRRSRRRYIFLECAQAAKTEYLVTGNIKHFPPSWEGTKFVAPRWLVDNLSGAAAEVKGS